MSERSLRIRDFRPKDLDVLLEIDRICFPADMVFSMRDFLYHLGRTDSITRIAVVSGRVAGFILGTIDDGREGRILTLDVIPEARRRGIGSVLMEDFHRILKQRKIHAASLEVAADNLAAQSLYEKMHYRCIEILPGYYNGKRDAYRMLRLI